MQKKIYSILIILSLLFLLSGCSTTDNAQPMKISIAEQYGLAYAPLTIMKEMGYLSEESSLDVEWKKLSNTAAIRESMLAGNVDLGFMAVPPFLIAEDKGMNWKIITGLSESPLGLMTNKENINSIQDLKSSDQIVLPQPGSVQHILLSMAAEREFAQADRFDDQLITMNHPDGMNALLSGQEVSAHFTSPPYIFMESSSRGIKKILSGREAFGGDFTFIVGVGRKEFYSRPELIEPFITSLNRAINFINQNPKQAAEILSKHYNLDTEKTLEYISWEGMKYSPEIKGIERFRDFLKKTGYLNSETAELESKSSQLIWEGYKYEK